MRSTVSLVVAFLWSFALCGAGHAELIEGEPGSLLLEKAEAYYADGSYALALPLFEKALAATTSGTPEYDWLKYRVADTRWRTVSGDGPVERETLDNARKELNVLADAIDRNAQGLRPPLLWARIMESLGDSWLQTLDQNTILTPQAWPYYDRALNWWASSTDVDQARQEYLNIVWRVSNLNGDDLRAFLSYRWNPVPAQVYVNALRIATDPEDRARAAFLLAAAQTGNLNQAEIGHMLAGVIPRLEGTAWYGALVFQYARWLETVGEVRYDEDGNPVRQPDYAGAVEWYERFLALGDSASSPFYREAKDRLGALCSVELDVSVRNTFLPNTPVSVYLNWRNIEDIEVRFIRLDWTKEWRWSKPGDTWFEHLVLDDHNILPEIRAPGGGPKYAPGFSTIQLEEGLPAGIYIVEAQCAGKKARDFLVVSSAVLGGIGGDYCSEEWIYYIADGFSGRLLPGAKLYFLKTEYKSDKGWGTWTVETVEADADGLLQVDFNGQLQRRIELFGVADGQPAYAGELYFPSRSDSRSNRSWTVYSYADRPAFRPGETAHWKIVARVREGSEYSVPVGQRVRVEVLDPNREVLSRTEHRLSAFGSAWGDVEVPSQAGLGMYQLVVYSLDDAGSPQVSAEGLFRVEEFRLPEYRVDIRMQRADGDGVILMGDPVEAVVSVEYYAGGGVPGAEVAVEVRRQPFISPLRPAGYAFDSRPLSRLEQFVMRETFVTDGEGKVTFQFQTDPFAGPQAQFVVVASAVDQSRRKISAQQSVSVSRQAYQAEVKPSRRLIPPQIAVDLGVKLLSPDDEPVVASGRLRVYRNEWRSYWRNAHGRMVSGAEWQAIKDSTSFQPAEWMFVREGWMQKEVGLYELTTDEDGWAQVSLSPSEPGSYTAEWVSVPPRGVPVRAKADFWVADEMTRVLNVRPGYNLIYDENSFRVGESVPVMVTTPKSNQAVLLGVLGDGFLAHKLVHVGNGPRLVRFDVDRLWAPNVNLLMMAVEDFSLHTDQRAIDVPNAPNLVEIGFDGLAEEYRPGDEVKLTFRTTDYAGKPVPAELSLAVFDESVRTIQGDLAVNPVDRFFPQRYRSGGWFNSSLSQGRPYSRLRREDVVEEASPVADGAIAREIVQERGVLMSRAESYGGIDAPAPGARSAVALKAANSEVNLEAVQVRADFRTTAFWAPDIVTDDNGYASVAFRLPDDLTQWTLVGRGATQANQFGQGEDKFRSSLPLRVRLATPRYLVAGDVTSIRPILRNNTSSPLDILAQIDVSGNLLSRQSDDNTIVGRIDAGAELAGDWRIAALEPGSGTIKIRAAGGEFSDGLERRIPVDINGIQSQVSFLSAADETAQRAVKFTVPQFASGTQQVEVFLSSSPVAAIFPAARALVTQSAGEESVDAVTNRALSLAIVARLADTYAISLQELTGRDDTSAAIQSMLEILAARQLSTGGWSWYPGGPDDVYMSAYAAWGVALLPGDSPVRKTILSRAGEYLDQRIVELDGNINLQAWVLHALATIGGEHDGRPSRNAVRAFTNLWRNRDRLSVYGRALLTLSAYRYGFTDELEILGDNLLNGMAWVDERNNTAGSTSRLAYWPMGDRSWRWYSSTVESTAFAMQALALTGKHDDVVQGAARWLLLNRRGAQWKNSRQTAVAINALATVAPAGLNEASAGFAFSLNGTPVYGVDYRKGEALLFSHRLTIDPNLIVPGENEFVIRRTDGEGPLYVSGVVRYMTAEQPVAATGNLSRITRRIWSVDPIPTLLRGYVPRYRFINPSVEARITPGATLETVLIFSVDSDIEYVRIVDPRAAGLEATETNSGYRYSLVQLDAETAEMLAKGELSPDQVRQRRGASNALATTGGYFQWRDKGLELNISSLSTGIWMVRYSHLAEFPGAYSWLPPQLKAVYIEELAANGDGSILAVEE